MGLMRILSKIKQQQQQRQRQKPPQPRMIWLDLEFYTNDILMKVIMCIVNALLYINEYKSLHGMQNILKN